MFLLDGVISRETHGLSDGRVDAIDATARRAYIEKDAAPDHLVLLGLFYGCYFRQRVDLDAGPVDLNFIGVHGRVRDHDLGPLDPLRLAYPDLFI